MSLLESSLPNVLKNDIYLVLYIFNHCSDQQLLEELFFVRIHAVRTNKKQKSLLFIVCSFKLLVVSTTPIISFYQQTPGFYLLYSEE